MYQHSAPEFDEATLRRSMSESVYDYATQKTYTIEELLRNSIPDPIRGPAIRVSAQSSLGVDFLLHSLYLPTRNTTFGPADEPKDSVNGWCKYSATARVGDVPSAWHDVTHELMLPRIPGMSHYPESVVLRPTSRSNVGVLASAASNPENVAAGPSTKAVSFAPTNVTVGPSVGSGSQSTPKGLATDGLSPVEIPSTTTEYARVIPSLDAKNTILVDRKRGAQVGRGHGRGRGRGRSTPSRTTPVMTIEEYLVNRGLTIANKWFEMPEGRSQKISELLLLYGPQDDLVEVHVVKAKQLLCDEASDAVMTRFLLSQRTGEGAIPKLLTRMSAKAITTWLYTTKTCLVLCFASKCNALRKSVIAEACLVYCGRTGRGNGLYEACETQYEALEVEGNAAEGDWEGEGGGKGKGVAR